MDEPQRFFFIHVLKTGGTDLFTRVGGDPKLALAHDPGFAAEQIYPNDTDRAAVAAPQISVHHLLQRWREGRDEIRLIMGHFPACTVDLLDADFVTLTVLREPVARTLSHLRHHRQHQPAGTKQSLEEIYEDPRVFNVLVHNHMVKMFGLVSGGLLSRDVMQPEHLERAKARLEQVDVVGLQDRFDDFCRELELRYGWQLGDTFHANSTGAQKASDAFRQRIAEDNALDMELWEFAQSLVARRSGAPRASAG